MKTNNKSLKTAAICGALAVLSLVNVCILSFNKSQVSPILTKNVNADAQQILGPYTLLFSLGEFFGNNNTYYKYDEIRTICNTVTISRGTMSLEQMRNSAFGLNATLTGPATTQVGVDGGATASIDAHKTSKSSFDFAVDIVLPGDNWKVKTCEPCCPNDPDVISGKCVTYDQCSEVIKMRVAAYKEALGIK